MTTMTNTNIYEYYLAINNQVIGGYLMTKEKDQAVRWKQKGNKIKCTYDPKFVKRRWGEGYIRSACFPACMCVWERLRDRQRKGKSLKI